VDIISIKIEDLSPAEYNPRQASEKQYNDLKKSIEKFGFVDPIIVNKRENRIVGGHFRYRVAKDMGIKEVPCVFVDLDEEDEKELNLRLNKNLGEWDWDLLAGFDEEKLVEAGFDPKELEKKLNIDIDGDEPEVAFGEELLEEQNYVVLYFDNQIDWLRAKEVLGIRSVAQKYQSKEAVKKGKLRKGEGRVIKGNDVIDKISGI